MQKLICDILKSCGDRIFLSVWVENAYSCPFWEVFVDLTPKWGALSTRPPNGTTLPYRLWYWRF